MRSLITLKALTYAPTGGIVAAPTTSLPEQIGGARNWDYRFCWLRDATLTLLALMNAGYYEEAQAWRDWLLRAVAGSPRQMQIMYGLAGERRLTEWEVPWLPGYEDSAPVRIGNAAHDQLQLDVFGEVMDALHQARAAASARNEAGWELQRALLEHLETIWQRAGRGHLGGARRARALHLFQGDGLGRLRPRDQERGGVRACTAPVDALARSCATSIHAEVCARGFDAELGSFVHSYGSQGARRQPAAAAGGRLPAAGRSARARHRRGDRARADGRRLRAALRHGHRRRRPAAGRGRLPRLQLLAGRRLSDARPPATTPSALFERLLSLRNDVGLLSEEYEPRTQRLVGNFPQAFSHLALVNTASNLAHYKKPAEQRSEQQVEGKRARAAARRMGLDHCATPVNSARIAAIGAAHSQGRSHVLFDVRTYRTLPARMPAQLELYSKFGYPVQLRYMGEPVVYAAAESGELNTFHHIWVYESAADREAKRAQMAKDPDWKVYLGENAKAGHIVEQRNVLMTPVAFAPKPAMPKIIK